MIPEPHRTYVLELLKALGPAADEFVVAGAQAMKFILERARATKDIDFVLDIVKLKGEAVSIAAKLKELGYDVVPAARNFQFEKSIPNSSEKMRIEFMAPAEFKRDKDIRVDVEKGVHARACTGGSIAIAESSVYQLSGKMPDGSPLTASIRVTKPHALVMLKLLALDDRYRNIRGPEEARHDREEARTHAADIVAVVSAQADLNQFKGEFQRQFRTDAALGLRIFKILGRHFRETTSPGILVYEEFLVADKPLDREARRQVNAEIARTHNVIQQLLPPKQFFELIAAIEDSCDLEQQSKLVEEFLTNLEQTRTHIDSSAAIERVPGSAFGGAFGIGETFTINAAEASKALSEDEINALRAQLQGSGEMLRRNQQLLRQFPHALAEGRPT